MNLWRVFEWLTQVVAPYMRDQDQCLYNAIVLTLTTQSDEYLVEVRDSAQNIAAMMTDELARRHVDRIEAAEATIIDGRAQRIAAAIHDTIVRARGGYMRTTTARSHIASLAGRAKVLGLTEEVARAAAAAGLFTTLHGGKS